MTEQQEPIRHIEPRHDDHPGEPQPNSFDGRGRAVCGLCLGVLRATSVRGRLVVHNDRLVWR